MNLVESATIPLRKESCMPARRIRWGILGCGGIVDRRTAPAINRARNAELVSVRSRDIEKAKKYAEKHGAKKYFSHLDEFLGDGETDAVYLATPPSVHAELVRRIAHSKKHILCEKPMAMTLAECREMVDECRKEGVKLMIANNMRFNPVHLKIKEIIEKRLLGNLVLARAQGSFYYPPDPKAWRLQTESVGGGPLVDTGIHCVDLLRWFCGEVTEVSAVTDNVIFDYSVEDTAIVTMKFANGGFGIVESCYSTRYVENALEVYGSKGTLLAKRSIWTTSEPAELRGFFNQTRRPHQGRYLPPPWAQNSSLGGWGSLVKRYYFQPRNTYTAEVEHFGECIEHDRSPLIDGAEGLKDLQVVRAAYKSSIEKRTVKISEVTS